MRSVGGHEPEIYMILGKSDMRYWKLLWHQ